MLLEQRIVLFFNGKRNENRQLGIGFFYTTESYQKLRE